MNQELLESSFLQPIGPLTPDQIEQACEAAFANANDLLDEAALLRESGRCARAFFLAHIGPRKVGLIATISLRALNIRVGARAFLSVHDGTRPPGKTDDRDPAA